MKANLFIHNDKMEILLANGKSFTPEKDQTKTEFIESIGTHVINEYVEKLELKEVDESAIRKVASAQLLKRLEHAKGLAKEMIEAVLRSRDKLDPAEEEAKRAKLIEEIEARREAEVNKRPELVFIKPKSAEPTLEQVFDMADQVRDDKGRRCKFKAFRSDKWEEGTINGIWIDKRVPMAMYRIKLDDPAQKMKNKKITSKDVIIL